MKNKFTIIGIVLTTVVLAGVAIFTAMRLYETRNQAVAPNVPSSRPEAGLRFEDNVPVDSAPACYLKFTISTATPPPICIQVITPAQNPKTGECRNFPTPCDVPAGWKIVAKCPTPTPTITPTATATPVVTGQPNSCGGTCGSNSNCASGLYCYQGFCRNPECSTASNCVCTTATPVATTTAKGTTVAAATPTEPSLPVVGTTWPTLLGTGFGVLVIIGSLLLAF